MAEKKKKENEMTISSQLYKNIKTILTEARGRAIGAVGKGFDPSNLWNMRKLYLTFPIFDALRRELSWTHYRLLVRVENNDARNFYLNECAKANWSTRQLERQIIYADRFWHNLSCPSAAVCV